MTNEKRDNNGALFKAKANENPRWPQYEGSVTVGGVDYWISAWVKEGRSGKFFSLAFKPKEKREEPAKPTQTTQRAAGAPFDDDIPF